MKYRERCEELVFWDATMRSATFYTVALITALFSASAWGITEATFDGGGDTPFEIDGTSMIDGPASEKSRHLDTDLV